ncbi:MAG: JAB domain-containing protein [Planctomycetota bacterium]|nr:JAB domain-containing protein [Planctomycetota bacterium]MDP6987976.1 JAB domain-containing protein [Planctomycetota bacterium]
MGRTPPGVGAGAAPASGAGLSRGSAEPSAELPCLLRAALGDRACSSGEDSWVEALLERMDLFTLSRASGPRIAAASSLGPRRARRLAAVFALGRHVEGARWEGAPDVSSPEAVHGLMAPRLRGLVVETFHVLLLDGKHRLRSVRRVSEGTLTTSLVHPREVFRPAIAEAAAAVVVAHNHPSGDPEPSREDLDVTRRLARVGRLIGIPLLDHVVVGHGVWVSIRDRITF